MSKLSEVLSNIFGLKGITQYDENEKIKIEGKRQQIAFIRILWIARYLSPFNIWCSIHRVGEDKPYGDNSLRSSDLYNHIHKVLNGAKAFECDIDKFRAVDVLNHLFEDVNISNQDIQDLVLYWVQTAFGRSFQQERCEIPPEEWMKNSRQQYLSEVKYLGLTGYIPPLSEIQYHEAWILGSSKEILLDRMKSLKRNMKAGIKIGKIRLLAGNKESSTDRELWAEIDGIGDDPVSKLEDGKRYLLCLADKYGLRYNKEKPFIEKKVQGSTRTYLNYLSDEFNRLTETLMGKDIYEVIFGRLDETAEITIFTRTNDCYRPTTISTALDVTDSLIIQLISGEYKDIKQVRILIVTNQPYILRQSSEVTEAVLLKLAPLCMQDRVVLNGTGDPTSSNTKIQIIHSELASLFGDRYKLAHQPTDRKMETLMYISRVKGIEGIPEFN